MITDGTGVMVLLAPVVHNFSIARLYHKVHCKILILLTKNPCSTYLTAFVIKLTMDKVSANTALVGFIGLLFTCSLMLELEIPYLYRANRVSVDTYEA